MTRLLKNSLGILALLLLTTTACKKDDPSSESGNNTPGVSSKFIRYELTGSYTGQLNVVYTNASGVSETAFNVTLPWSLELTAESTVNAVAFNAATSSTSTVGLPGQNVQAKLYTGNVLRQSANGNTSNEGHVIIGTLTHVF